jgi:predicted ribosomally synthesized peptide with SipW-like signal peptide
MTKKNIKKPAIAAALIGCMALAGISAYFTDGDTATNTFTVGKVSLDLQEPNFDEEDDAKDITPLQEIQKDPQVLNDGVNDEYIFVKVTVPYENIVVASLDGTAQAAADTELFSYSVNSDWTEIKLAEDNGGISGLTTDMGVKDTDAKTVTHLYAYTGTDASTMEVLSAGATTSTVFDYVKLANVVEDTIETSTQDIIVTAYGIQTTNLNESGSYDGVNSDGVTAPSSVWSIVANAQPSTAVDANDEEDSSTDIKASNAAN